MELLKESGMAQALLDSEILTKSIAVDFMYPDRPHTNQELEFWGHDFINTRQIPSDMKFGEYMEGVRAIGENRPFATRFDQQLISHVLMASRAYVDLPIAA